MFRNLFITLLLTLTLLITLSHSAPVPIPGRLAISVVSPDSTLFKRSSPLSAATRTLTKSIHQRSPSPEKIGDVPSLQAWMKRAIEVVDGARVDLQRGWKKREVEQLEKMIVRAEGQLDELVKRRNDGRKVLGERAPPARPTKFVGRSKVPSDPVEEQSEKVRQLRKKSNKKGKGKSSKRSTSSSSSSSSVNKASIARAKRAVPAEGLDQSALGKCFYVGADFLMHDCNETVDVQAASLNSAKTPEELKIFSSASAALAAATAGAAA